MLWNEFSNGYLLLIGQLGERHSKPLLRNDIPHVFISTNQFVLHLEIRIVRGGRMGINGNQMTLSHF